MVVALHGDAVWLSVKSFQETLLPKPPPSVMLSGEQLKALTNKLEDMHAEEGYMTRGQNACPPRQPGDQLAQEFIAIVNEYVLEVVEGQLTKTNVRRSSRNSEIVHSTVGTSASAQASKSTQSRRSPIASTSTLDNPSSANPTSRYSVTLVDTVPSYVMRLSPYGFDESEEERNKATAAIFMNDDVGRLQEDRLNWTYQRLFGVFKLPGTASDPFEDGELINTQPSVDSRAKARGQLIEYADRVFAHQHRTAVFSFIVFGQELRFMRWDRAGVFVTEKIDYVKDTRTFVELLLGFLVLDGASQGIDTTVTLLEKGSELYTLMESLASADPEVLKMRVLPYDEGSILPSDIPTQVVSTRFAADDSDMDNDQPARSSPVPSQPASGRNTRRPEEGSYVFQYVLDYFVNSLQDEWPRYRIPIGGETFLVARPIFDTAGLTGRGTRGYIAWHEQSHTFVFLKDAWRPFYKGVDTEGDILKRLNDAGIGHIPTLLCHGQVATQESLVSHYVQYVDHRTNDERKAETRSNAGPLEDRKRARDSEDSHRIRHYAHHRLASKEVGLPLAAFTCSKQLVSVVYDCVDGHADAVNKCGLLHRDISSGNILILPTFEEKPGDSELHVTWEGLLCDWELSKPITTRKTEEGHQPERMGTWRYMSVASLRNVLHEVAIADELESFCNVILYNAVRYLPHTAERCTPRFIHNYFNRAERKLNGELTVSSEKARVISSDGYLSVDSDEGRTRLWFGTPTELNQGLNGIFSNLLRWFKARYEVMRYEKLIAKPSEDALAPELYPRDAQRPRFEGDVPVTYLNKNEGPYDPLDPSAIDEPRPSPATYADAARLDAHDEFKSLLRQALSRWRWPEHDFKSDHLTCRHAGATEPSLADVSFDNTLPSPVVSFDLNGRPRAPTRKMPPSAEH